MGRIHPECPGSDPPDRLLTDVLVREEPDEDEDEEEDGKEDDDDDDTTDDGYSERACPCFLMRVLLGSQFD
jgi:hypothetical protein